MPTEISVHSRSPGLEPDTIDIVVTLPTFRRPEQVKATLASIAAQTTDLHIAVVVMDNDDEKQEGAVSAGAYLGESNLRGMVIIAHQRGNCHAYNAGWSTALTTFPNASAIAVIDDDEIARPTWLAELVSTMEATSADLVGGPQVPVFGDDAPKDRRDHPVFRPPYNQTGRVPILYSSGNVLIARRVLEAMPRPFLDPRFNFIGGGDSDFYRRCREKGFTFAWCAEAAVDEAVPSRRTEMSWLNARSLRNGAISALIEHRMNGGFAGRARTIAKSLALLAASPIRGARLWAESGSPVTGLYHAQVAIGRLMAELGLVGEQYRNPEKN